MSHLLRITRGPCISSIYLLHTGGIIDEQSGFNTDIPTLPVHLPPTTGFGLQVPPPIHRLLTACGIRDASAKIYGSANPQEVLRCAIQMLHGGVSLWFHVPFFWFPLIFYTKQSNPPGFGSGTGRSGRRVDKGSGMRSTLEIERERGRYGINVGKRL